MKYFLTLMFIDGKDCRNSNFNGFFSTKEAAEKYLMENWFSIFEYWTNTAVIEEINEGGYPGIGRIKSWWYQTDNAVNRLPSSIEKPEIFKNVYGFVG